MVDYEMGRILSNIMDPNTKATDKRKVKVELEFVPDEYRQTVKVSAQVARCGNAVPPPFATVLVRANLPEYCTQTIVTMADLMRAVAM